MTHERKRCTVSDNSITFLTHSSVKALVIFFLNLFLLYPSKPLMSLLPTLFNHEKKLEHIECQKSDCDLEIFLPFLFC